MLTAELIERARADASERSGVLAVDLLADRLSLDADALLPELAAVCALPPVAQEQWRAWTPDDALVPLVDASARVCAAFRDAAGDTVIVLADPFAERTRLWLARRLREAGRRASWRLASAAVLRAWLHERERSNRLAQSLPGREGEGTGGMADEDGRTLRLSAADLQQADLDPVVRLVNVTLYDALNASASDIHLESDPAGMSIRYRLDGVLVSVGRIEGVARAQQAVSRIKVLADLDIAERRLPQDGRMKVRTPQREIDLRVSIMPSIHGEDAVLRVLDRYQLTGEHATLTVDRLNLHAADAAMARRLAARPYGLMLVTGPTGSGKTTTLYALLNEINDGLDKIATIEDPVEYELPGVLQIPVNEAKGLTFARGLRSLLRHDPDRIMVGEIRDAETAQIAIQAALTGHQVFATVHANNAIDVVGRLASMGADPYNLAASLNGILAQRLLRVVCTNCAVPHRPDAAALAAADLPEDWPEGKPLRRGQGCGRCRGTGFRGRQAVTETVELDEALRTLIAGRAPLSEVRAQARRNGTRTLREAAVAMAAEGFTTLEEVDRVTAVDR